MNFFEKKNYLYEKENRKVPEIEIEKKKDEFGNKIMNGYKKIKLLGFGAFSKVKLVEKNGKKYAMKIINKDALRKKNCFQISKEGKILVNPLLENVMKEIAILKKINHKNIIKLYEIIYNNDKNKVYLILEYIEKGNLIYYNEEEEIFYINNNYKKDKKNTEESFYSELEIKNFIRDISLGINYLHHQGIIHRDIKPENILLSKNYQCKIIDFNVSAMLPDSKDDNIGKKVEGTNLFRAPETCTTDENGKTKNLKGKPLDIWALGITSFILAYRIFPFKLGDVDSSFDLFETIINNQLQFPDEIIVDNNNVNNNSNTIDNKNGNNINIINNNFNCNDKDNFGNLSNDNITNTYNVNFSICEDDYSNVSKKNLDYSNVHLSDGFKDFIRGCLEKDPNKRFTIKDVLRNKWLNENFVPLLLIQDLHDITVNTKEINDCLGFFEKKQFIKNYANWVKKKTKIIENDNNIETLKRALSNLKEINYDLINNSNENESNFENLRKKIFMKNEFKNKIMKNLYELKSNNNLESKDNENNRTKLTLPKINQFKDLKSLEYDALKRKSSCEKIKLYTNYKLVLVHKYNSQKERKNSVNEKTKYSKRNNNLKKNNNVCLSQKIGNNLSLIKIKFPIFNSLSKKNNFFVKN